MYYLELLLQQTNLVFNIILIALFILNLFFSFTIVFLERRSPGSIWAWLLVLAFLPILGFIIYLLFGRQIQREHIFKINEEDKTGLEMIVQEQAEALKNDEFSKGNHVIVKHKSMVQMLLYNNSAFLTTDNALTIYNDGKEKFEALIHDIENAQSYIHIEYYIFRNDILGKRILKALEDKLDEGLEVKMLYDDMGSRGLTLKDFDEFRKKKRTS